MQQENLQNQGFSYNHVSRQGPANVQFESKTTKTTTGVNQNQLNFAQNQPVFAQNFASNNFTVPNQIGAYSNVIAGQNFANIQAFPNQNIIQGGFQNAPFLFNEGRRSLVLDAGVRRSMVLDGGVRRSVVLDGGFNNGGLFLDAGVRRSVVLEPRPVVGQYIWNQPQVVRPIYILAGQQQVTTEVNEDVEQWKLKCQQLEAKIRSLEERLRTAGDSDLLRSQYESKMQEYMNEIERLNGVLRMKLEEIDRLRGFQTRCIEYEGQMISMQNEIEALKSELERALIQKKQKADEAEEFRRKYMRLEGEMNQFQNELRRLEDESGRKTREINELKTKISRYEVEIRELRSSLELITEYENKIALLSQEVERLNSMLKRKTDENNNLSQRINDLEGELQEYTYQITEFRTKTNRVDTLIQELRMKDQKIMELENQIAMLSQEIERLNSMLKKKQSESDNVNKRTSTLQISIEERDIEIMNLRQDYDRLAREADEWRIKHTTIITEIKIKENMIFELENKVALLSQEIERLNKMLNNRNQELESWKLKYTQLEEESVYGSKEKLSALSFELEQKIQMYETLNGKYQFISGYIVLLCAEIDALRMQMDNNNKQFAEEKKVIRQSVVDSGSEKRTSLLSYEQPADTGYTVKRVSTVTRTVQGGSERY